MERGSAVALVLLILIVISLIGVAALVQSKFDLRFATAIQSYNKMFNLADGASLISLKSLSDTDHEPYPSVAADGTLSSPPVTIETKTISTVGKYSSQLQFFSYSTAASASRGWEESGYYAQYWGAEGVGTRETALGTDSNSVVDIGVIVFSQK